MRGGEQGHRGRGHGAEEAAGLGHGVAPPAGGRDEAGAQGLVGSDGDSDEGSRAATGTTRP